MDRVKMLLREFCEENSEKYEIYESYSGRNMFGRTCLGIIVKKGFSHLELIIELTSYLNDSGLENDELEFSEGISIDELGLDTIVYFPRL